ncbi:hypothetical protein BG006_010165 [Podila minutissima]|uniref:Disintegrin and metalloproteinase domain-containing protein B n=1 Tax=Podila minutissima TaxID=64525 RepID=A0A9P5SGC8_9FUNG|nr:hypothetical protein BG006_010165 [Podila minutissima]
MVLLTTQVSLLVLALAFAPLASSHSTAWPTIAYAEELQPVRHDILPRSAEHQRTHEHALRRHLLKHHDQPLAKRQLDNCRYPLPPTIIQKNDHVRLALTAYNTTYYLHLEPNFDLIHPDLHLSGGGVFDSQSNGHDHFKAFKGIVVQDQDLSQRKWDQAMATSMSEKATVEHMLYEEGVLGWARMMIEHDENDDSIILRGAFNVGDDTYHVTTRQHYHIQKRSDDHAPLTNTRHKSNLVIYRDSDLLQTTHQIKKRSTPAQSSCGTKGQRSTEPHGYYYPPDLTSPLSPSSSGSGLFGMINSGILHKRAVNTSDIMVTVAGPNPVPSGCPQTRMVAYIGVAADCTYVRSYNGLANARKQIFADFNTASGIYESTFNVALGIKAMVIESMNCPKIPAKGVAWNQECSTNYTISNRLSDFSFWRGQSGRAADGIGLWHLMTKCSSGSILGIAWTKALCQTTAVAQGMEYTSGTGVSTISPYEWMVVAHELGHGFGAQHDCTDSTCITADSVTGPCCPLSDTVCDAQDRYIMNPSEQATTKIFSPCSISAICSTIAGSNGKCLRAPTLSTSKVHKAAVNVCGNGIKEDGEQCDCGSPEECALDPCCNGATCTYKAGVVCDDLNDDCCRGCQLAPKGLTCRSALSTCDVVEKCTGTSPTCPPDVIVPDRTVCHGPGNFTGQCAQGVCTSRDLQCAQQQRSGITHQCMGSTSGCELLCNDPSGATNSCIKIPGANFVDGTVCGSNGAGTCAKGKCVLPGGWVPNHLSIFIPVVCVAILLIIGGVVGIICLRRRRKGLGLKTNRVRAVSFASMAGPSTGPGAPGGTAGVENKNKDTDVPRWMLANRRDSQAVFCTSRRSSQTVLPRRNSAQIMRGSEETGASANATLSGPTAQELQKQYFEQFQRLQEQRQQQDSEEQQNFRMQHMHSRTGEDGQELDLGNVGQEHPMPPYNFQEYHHQDVVHPFEVGSYYSQDQQDLPHPHPDPHSPHPQQLMSPHQQFYDDYTTQQYQSPPQGHHYDTRSRNR